MFEDFHYVGKHIFVAILVIRIQYTNDVAGCALNAFIHTVVKIPVGLPDEDIEAVCIPFQNVQCTVIRAGIDHDGLYPVVELLFEYGFQGAGDSNVVENRDDNGNFHKTGPRASR